MQAQLSIERLSLQFGGVRAVDDVSFAVAPGELVSLIGPNGAGKTSILNCINKFYTPRAGRIVFAGEDITALRPHQVAARGIARTFQNVELFRGMTVLDNIKLGRHLRMQSGVLASLLYYGRCRREELAHRQYIEEKVIDLLELEDVRQEVVGALPFGIQKRVELARALAADPRFLLLDEPTAGMNLEETEDMVRYILDVKEVWKVTILLVEHDMGVVMDISDRVIVLNFGQRIAEGPPHEVAQDPEVIRAYLGEKQHWH